jgi:hypothetical protein
MNSSSSNVPTTPSNRIHEDGPFGPVTPTQYAEWSQIPVGHMVTVIVESRQAEEFSKSAKVLTALTLLDFELKTHTRSKPYGADVSVYVLQRDAIRRKEAPLPSDVAKMRVIIGQANGNDLDVVCA